MQKCPQCGFFHSSADVRCIRCGTLLAPTGRPDPLAQPGREGVDLRPARSNFLTRLLMRLHGRAGRVLYSVTRLLRSELPTNVHHRNPWVSGLLATIPGLGQLYNHQPKRAALIGMLVITAITLAAFTWYSPLSNYFLLACLLIWLYAMHDAFMTARAINRDAWFWTASVAYYCAWLLYLSVGLLLLQWVSSFTLIKFRHIYHNEMVPYLSAGDRVGINIAAYIVGKPRLGDIVYVTNYSADHSRSFALESGSDRVLVQPRNYIERIVGLPGDTFERRAGQFFRNGNPVPPSEQPVVQDQLPFDFKLTAPLDCYIILMSYTGSDIDPSMGPVLMQTVMKAPRLNGGWIPLRWEPANYVPLSDIEGRMWFVYQPPPARRWLH